MATEGGKRDPGVGEQLYSRPYAFDFFQGHPGILGQSGATHHFGGGLFHGNHRLVGVSLNRPHQGLDLPGRRRRALRQPLHFIGHSRGTFSGALTSNSLRRLASGTQPYLHTNTIAAIFSPGDHQVDNRKLSTALRIAP